MKIESDSGILFSTLSGQSASQCSNNSTEDVIEINGLFASKQGFKNGQVVGIAYCYSYSHFALFLSMRSKVSFWFINSY